MSLASRRFVDDGERVTECEVIPDPTGHGTAVAEIISIPRVELLIAQAHYAHKAYPEAIAAFTDFQRMHPTSPHLAEVEYTTGLAYADQMNTVDRDLSEAFEARGN